MPGRGPGVRGGGQRVEQEVGEERLGPGLLRLPPSGHDRFKNACPGRTEIEKGMW